MLDSIGQRYGALPSEILKRADTVDLLVLDVARSWEAYQHEKTDAQNNSRPVTPQIPLNTLQDMMDRVKNQ